MIKRIKRNLLLLSTLTIGLGSCEKSRDIETVDQDSPANILGTAKGLLPENGETCADVEVISDEPLKVSVFFQWSSAEYADSYELRIFESQNEIYNETLALLETTVELNRGKSYSWFVIARNSGAETVGNTHSFTTPGESVGNYVPYSAVISMDFNLMTSEMDISWQSSDEDDDTLIYDVSVSENEELLMEFTDLSVDFINEIPFAPGSSYTVEVISKDKVGSFSISRHHETAPE